MVQAATVRRWRAVLGARRPDRRLRWSLKLPYESMGERRRQEGLTWRQLAATLGLSSQPTHCAADGEVCDRHGSGHANRPMDWPTRSRIRLLGYLVTTRLDVDAPEKGAPPRNQSRRSCGGCPCGVLLIRPWLVERPPLPVVISGHVHSVSLAAVWHVTSRWGARSHGQSRHLSPAECVHR